MLEIPTFETNKELHNWLSLNEKTLISQKKSAIKYADGFMGFAPAFSAKGDVTKENQPITNLKDLTVLNVKAIINTTNILDSYRDVHIKNIWDVSLKQNKGIMHVQEHKSNQFDKIIADGVDLKAYVKDYTFKDLGFNYEGTTQALSFDSVVRKERNSFMFDQYGKGYVKQHSVGMIYMKVVMCINDEDYPEKYENWQKYVGFIANKEALEGISYFWAVIEAKAIEGSAVPMGANFVTPTYSNNGKSDPVSQSLVDDPSSDSRVLDKCNELLTKFN